MNAIICGAGTAGLTLTWWQHGQIRDRLTAVGEHHRQIDRDPARVVYTAPLP